MNVRIHLNFGCVPLSPANNTFSHMLCQLTDSNNRIASCSACPSFLSPFFVCFSFLVGLRIRFLFSSAFLSLSSFHTSTRDQIGLECKNCLQLYMYLHKYQGFSNIVRTAQTYPIRIHAPKQKHQRDRNVRNHASTQRQKAYSYDKLLVLASLSPHLIFKVSFFIVYVCMPATHVFIS